MKIVLFTENQRFGGMDTFITNLIEAWPDKNDSFLLICNENHPGLKYLSDNLDIKIIKHNIPLSWSFLSILISVLPSILKRFLRQIFKLLLLPYQYFKIKTLLKSVIGDALISINGAYPGGETCRIASIVWHRLGRNKSIHNIHNYAIQSRLIIRPIENIIDKKLSKSVNAIVSVSNNCANSLNKRKNIDKSKIQIIRNGIKVTDNNSPTYSLRKMLKIPEDHKIITMIGSLEERKGHEFLFKSMRKVYDKYNNISLIVIGTGTPEEIKKINYYSRHHLKDRSVHFTGELENATSYLKDSDLLVIPSQADESFGLTAIEAMLCNNAIVSTNIGGLPETIGENGGCGFYVDRDNSEDFSEKIIYLVENDEKRRKMAENGRLRALKYFSSSDMSRNYHSLLKV